MTATCKSCGARIVWAYHHKTKSRMPLEEAESGTWTIECGVARPREELLDTSPAYASHFSTCPHASDWRKS